MADEALTDFVCPNCNEPVQEDWSACPSCGIEFGPAEEEATPPPKEETPAAAPPEAAAPAATPPKAKAPPKGSKGAAPRKGGGVFARWPVVGPIARRVGTVGVLGLGLLLVGIIGWYVVSNYDTLLAGRTENSIGPNQANYVMMMALAAAAGGGLTILGLFMARGAPAGAGVGYQEMEGTKATAEVESRSAGRTARVDVPAPAREAPAAPPERAATPPPAAVAAAPEAVEEEEEDEEVGALELPASPPAEAAPEPEAASASEAISTSDELEDLFGELESEVQAAAEEEEVLYECPNCHGVVKEDDASCPHCNAVFEA